ncbi:MAG: putative Ig domain-containing protein [Sciscionella sp.]|nr:putative Ig domain-containing protein [Sciscionella sp.]
MRGLTAIAGMSALALIWASASAQATPASGASASAATAQPQVAHVCNQSVGHGTNTCFALKRTDIKEPKALGPDATPSGYGPSDLQSAYTLPSSSAGSGETVAVVDAYDDPNAESDLSAYRSQYGLPACTTSNGCFKKVNQNGQSSPLPSGDTGWAGEESLDLDMVSAVCPNCHILFVEANDASNNLYTAVNTAVSLGAKYVSMSWGGNEDGSENSYDSQYFNHPGVVFTASSGDSAYSAGVIYPSTSQYVTSVGGTSLNKASNSRGWSESVWNTSSSEGTGSGCSSDVTKPSFQSIIPSSTCSHRADTDVSAVADPATGVAVYQTYGGSGWTVYGGTSASAPIIASVYALAGTPGSSDHPNSYPYSHTSNLNDVTSGNNGSCSPSVLCTAGSGWDGPTGLGTPNGVAAFKSGGGGGGGNTVTVTNPGSQTGTAGTAASLQIKASDSASGQTLTYSASGLPTGLSINSSTGLISGTPSANGTFNVTVTVKDSTGASGSTSFTWTIGGGGGGGSCSGQKLLNPGFESGATSWTASSGVINTDGQYAHTGTGYAWLDGYGSTHTDTLSQSVSIPSGCTATLSYYLYIASDEGTSTAYDTLKLTANGTTVQSFSNKDQGSGYVKRTVSLSSYAGQTVTLKWTGSEDSALATSFLIDDTALNLS